MKKAPLNAVKIASAASLAADYTTDPTSVGYQDNVVYQVNVLTGTPVGTVNIETSTDYNPITHESGNWQSLGSAYASTINGTGTGIIDANQLGPAWVRLKYTRSSSTGTMDVWISAKQV